MKSVSVIVPVKYEGGKYVASNPKPIRVSGIRGDEFSLRIMPTYDCKEEQLPQYTKNIKANVRDSISDIGVRTDEYFDFHSVFRDGITSIDVQQVIFFRRSEGHTIAVANYVVKVIEEVELENPGLPSGSNYAVWKETRPVIFARAGDTEFHAMVGDFYYGHDSRPLRVVELVPVGGPDSISVLESSSLLPGNGGIHVKCQPLKEWLSYSLVLQPGEDSSDKGLFKFWVTTKRELV